MGCGSSKTDAQENNKKPDDMAEEGDKVIGPFCVELCSNV